jgi:acetyl coenzyme A synthetase (ADP forming)-like protein
MDPAYPAHREADVALRDGSTVHVRPVRGDEDIERILVFLTGLSDESRYLRFFSGYPNLQGAAESSAQVDHVDRFGLLATVGTEGRVVGHAMYYRTKPGRAEVAFTVSDDYQGHGLGTILLGHLAEAASANGISVFEAQVLPQNHRMVEVFRESGFSVAMRSEPGAIVVEFPTSFSPDAAERFERREQTSAVAALRTFLAPRSVAVIGASRTRGTIGGEVFHNLLAGGFNGPVYPVNPQADVVQSVVAYPTVGDIPGEIDLGVVVVPAALVVPAARECGEKGVRALVVISSGFGEVGDEGRALQRELVGVCREFGMRLIGPNCMGIMNTAADVRLNATFGPSFPPHGRVGFMSQSGALGLAVIDRTQALGLGISSFVSVGNKADISGNDLLHYWEEDEDTDLILLYLESFGNPRRFARITRRVGRSKPIVAVKSGRSAAGVRATSSHTGALLAASDVTVDALFRQAGVIRTDTLAELFDVASLLANQPPPAGPRVGIVTNAGGLGILCADACEADGLQVAPLPERVTRRLAEFLPAEASLANPVDMIASASDEDYRRTIELLVEEGGVDALIVIFIPPLVTRAEDVARAIRVGAGSLRRPVPLLTVFMSARGVPDELRGEGVRIPSFAFPEEAARVLAHAVRYGQWRERPQGVEAVFPEARGDEAAAVISAALVDGPRWLHPDEVATLLSCYGVPLAEWRLAGSPAEAGEAAEAIGGPVAVKAVAPKLLHKTEARGVRLNVDPVDVAGVAAEMRHQVAGAGFEVERFLVQRMVPSGVEMLVGMVHDPSFGPVVAVGAGGTAVELLKDVAVRITPLTDLDAHEMVTSLKTFPLLTGYRGAPPADVVALEEVVLRIGAMVDAHPEIAELDCNPVVVLTDRALVVDARVRVEVPLPLLPVAARRPA